MNVNIMTQSIFIFIFLLQSTSILDKVIYKYFKKRFNLVRCWDTICLKIKFLVTKCLVNFSYLISIIVYVSHNILIKLQLLSLLFDFLIDVSYLTRIQSCKEITQNINTSENVTIMAI
jgi:hypothetical protein